jgi:hypothetical protein
MITPQNIQALEDYYGIPFRWNPAEGRYEGYNPANPKVIIITVGELNGEIAGFSVGDILPSSIRPSSIRPSHEKEALAAKMIEEFQKKELDYRRSLEAKRAEALEEKVKEAEEMAKVGEQIYQSSLDWLEDFKHPDTELTDAEKALHVLALSKPTIKFLAYNDPKALKQAQKAINNSSWEDYKS